MSDAGDERIHMLKTTVNYFKDPMIWMLDVIGISIPG